MLREAASATRAGSEPQPHAWHTPHFQLAMYAILCSDFCAVLPICPRQYHKTMARAALQVCDGFGKFIAGSQRIVQFRKGCIL